MCVYRNSFTPRPLPVQGEAKFSLRCRMYYTCGVNSPEERTMGEYNGTIRYVCTLDLFTPWKRKEKGSGGVGG